MRSILIFLGFMLFTVPAFADSISDYCLTTKDPRGCLSSFMEDQARYNQMLQRDAQLEQARIQANGMAMMGMGAAFVNGMNQHLQNMQQPRYAAPTIQPYSVPAPRTPINCLSQTYGANMPSVTCY